jgi:hypothetical protein
MEPEGNKRSEGSGAGLQCWLQRAAVKRIFASWLIGIGLAAPPWIVQTKNIDLYHDIGDTANTVYLILALPGFIFATWVDRDHRGSINVSAMANSVFYGLLVYGFLVRRAKDKST